MKRKQNLKINNTFSIKADVTLYLGDRLDLIEQIKQCGDKAELIITSPPYNTGKEYEEQTSLEEYIKAQSQTISACVDILSETGSICWQVGHYIKGSSRNKEAFPLDLVLYPIFKENGLILKNRVVWHFGHGLHETVRFSGRHETILWFVRSENYTFNLDPIRIPQKYPGKRSYRGDKIGKPSGNPSGKNPSDVWDIPNVKANHIEKTEHPCQFPVGMINRLVLGLTNEGDLVFDPYIGVGTSAVSAVLNNRRAAGADIMQKYLDIAEERIRKAWEGTLKIRPMNKPVYKPSGRESVSQIPKEWKE
ncbi:site-specific DNA-methyltransferase [Candidatus Dojkabacteria bacterium]|nr:site-specific DNA-methyltransferase [Candidatus Dojkabacteria bacterium]